MRAVDASTPSTSTDEESPRVAPSVELRDVVVRRGPRVALRNVTFALQPGTVTAVVGPNGAGKSSLLGVLSGRLSASEGLVRLDGAVAEVLQSTRGNEQLMLTVEDIVRMGRYADRGLFGRLRPSDRAVVERALEATDLVDLRRRSFNELSGGQRQRTLVAQGLARQTPILLLDEPTAGLDVRSQRHLSAIIRAEAAKGTTVIVATHDLDDAGRADNVIVLACDCLCCAPPVTALADPAVTALFETSPRWARSA
ncbi:MAG: ABC transporter ATP-binding protein [Actinomycetota bacterium]